jgi:predicted TIM-barrel fold metal-dependent hydrolase
MIIDGHRHICGDPAPILASMDKLGIDCTVLAGVGVRNLSVVTIRDSLIFRVPWMLETFGVWKSRRIVRSLRFRETLLPQPENDLVEAAIRKYPNRFRGFVFVNPVHPHALDQVERRLSAGFCGIKLALLQYPAALDGPQVSALCEIASARGIPVFFHQGLTASASDPTGMMKRFPKVNFIIAHAGVQYFDQAIELARAQRNVWLDTSSYFVTLPKLRRLVREVGAEKLVFGSDVPVMAMDAGQALNKIKALDISEQERSAILGGNLMQILDSSNEP